MKKIPTRLDRYPAKMVTRLADTLISKYADECTRLLDPFCGSGALLVAGKNKGIPATGVDLNPYAVLLSKVKLRGFDISVANDVCTTWDRLKTPIF
jgi:site-specific DNA-methyltransferase (cytosine-N4-specific)